MTYARHCRHKTSVSKMGKEWKLPNSSAINMSREELNLSVLDVLLDFFTHIYLCICVYDITSVCVSPS